MTKDYTVAAVQEALAILMHVAQCPGLGATELAKRSGNTKMRTFRLLSTLEQSGFVQRSKDSAIYGLGHMALLLGVAAKEQVTLVRAAEPHLEALSRRFNEGVQLSVRDGNQVVCVAKVDSTHDVRIHTEVGRRRPLHAGASGKVLLAFAPAELRSAVLDDELERYTPTTIVSKAKLTKELNNIRASGIATSHGEIVPDAVAMAAPVHDPYGSVVGALGMSMPSSRAPADLAKYAQAVRAAADSLSAELGWTGPR